MAIDEYFLNMAEQEKINGSLRFYTWNPVTISIGYFFKIKYLDLERIKRDNIAIVRRSTGGNIILHKNDFTYSFILRKGTYDIGNKKDFYIFTANILKDALTKLGIDSMINTTLKTGENNTDCFGSISNYEISDKDGIKLIGSAQKIGKHSILQHGSFLYDYNPEEINRYLIIKPAISRKKKADFKLAPEEINKNFKDSFMNHFILKEYKPAGKDLKKIDKLIKEKYSNNEWTYGK